MYAENHKEFFDNLKGCDIDVNTRCGRVQIDVEELYQHFKARFIG